MNKKDERKIQTEPANLRRQNEQARRRVTEPVIPGVGNTLPHSHDFDAVAEISNGSFERFGVTQDASACPERQYSQEEQQS